MRKVVKYGLRFKTSRRLMEMQDPCSDAPCVLVDGVSDEQRPDRIWLAPTKEMAEFVRTHDTEKCLSSRELPCHRDFCSHREDYEVVKVELSAHVSRKAEEVEMPSWSDWWRKALSGAFSRLAGKSAVELKRRMKQEERGDRKIEWWHVKAMWR